ncbi:MAG: adenosylcobinamide-GDP ribazoletransferase [Candidatus Puniceispirillaceae bacterium]
MAPQAKKGTDQNAEQTRRTDRRPGRLSQSPLGDLAAAFLLLSRLPVFWHSFDDDSPPDFVSAQWAFPAVGLIVGGIAGLVLWLSILLDFPVIIAATLALAAMLALTGAMHEDGLADTVDGFGGGGDAKTKARIMRDSHIGSYGVMGLCLSTIARIGLLVALVEQSDGWLLVIIMAIVGAGARFQVLAMLRLYPISSHAKLGMLTGRPTVRRGLAGMAIWVLPLMISVPQIGGAAAVVGATAISLWLGKLAVSQIGGLSGDVMGASIILGEISILSCVIIALASGYGT